MSTRCDAPVGTDTCILTSPNHELHYARDGMRAPNEAYIAPAPQRAGDTERTLEILRSIPREARVGHQKSFT